MKIPLVYPKIADSKNCMLKNIYAYEKLDGTNIHFCWNKKDKFYAFGTRRDRFPITLLGESEFKSMHPGLEDVVESFIDCGMHQSFMEKIDKVLSGIGDDNPYPNPSKIPYSLSEVIIFTEFLGNKSFAGQHNKDDHKDHYLIDVQVDGKFIDPKIMEHDFKDLYLCRSRLIYHGKFTGSFVERVRKGFYSVNEGVVCKGLINNEVYMCKIKTNAYLEKLKTKFKDNWNDYWE